MKALFFALVLIPIIPGYSFIINLNNKKVDTGAEDYISIIEGPSKYLYSSKDYHLKNWHRTSSIKVDYEVVYYEGSQKIVWDTGSVILSPYEQKRICSDNQASILGGIYNFGPKTYLIVNSARFQ